MMLTIAFSIVFVTGAIGVIVGLIGAFERIGEMVFAGLVGVLLIASAILLYGVANGTWRYELRDMGDGSKQYRLTPASQPS